MTTFLVRFRFHLRDQVARRTWYDVGPHDGPESAGSHWAMSLGQHARWVCFVVVVPTFSDPDSYVEENLGHWADQAARHHLRGMTVLGDWHRNPQAVR